MMEALKGCAMFLGIMILIFFGVLLLELIVFAFIHAAQEEAERMKERGRKVDKRKEKV